MQSIAVASSRSRAADGGHELVDRRVGLDGHERRHVHAPQRAHAAEVVADEVDDHEVLGARLLVVAQRGAAVGVLDRMGGARRGALDRLGLDHPLAVDAQEALGRGAQHRQVAEAQQRRVRRRVARAQRAVGGERLDRAVAAQLGGQADLVALALEDLVLAGGDVGEVGLAALAGGEAQRARPPAGAARQAAGGARSPRARLRWPSARPRRRARRRRRRARRGGRAACGGRRRSAGRRRAASRRAAGSGARARPPRSALSS